MRIPRRTLATARAKASFARAIEAGRGFGADELAFAEDGRAGEATAQSEQSGASRRIGTRKAPSGCQRVNPFERHDLAKLHLRDLPPPAAAGMFAGNLLARKHGHSFRFGEGCFRRLATDADRVRALGALKDNLIGFAHSSLYTKRRTFCLSFAWQFPGRN